MRKFMYIMILASWANLYGDMVTTEYEVIDSFATEEIETKIERKDEEKYIYRGRTNLADRRGTLYTVTDPIALTANLDINSRKIVYDNTPVNFYIYTNYEKLINRYEILIYDTADTMRLRPIETISGERVVLNTPILWEGQDSKKEVAYVLRVYDEKGRYDETHPRTITFKDMTKVSETSITKEEDIKDAIYGQSNLAIQNIPLSGSKVRIYGKDLFDVKTVKIGGQAVEVDRSGDFIFETMSGAPKEIFDVELEYLNGKNELYPIEVENPENYEFLVGLADFYLGQNKVTGSDAILENGTDYQEDFFNTGRLAFYYKKIYDKYRITAQADTWSKEIKHMFTDFYERDKTELFRKIDRDYINFNYGDESFMYTDVNTEGKAYLRVDWDKSQVLWGSYETGFTGPKYAEYNRTLYGARGEYNSLETNDFGDSRYRIAAFGSKPDTTYQRDSFLGTGGSVYYLSERDIVVGSAKLTVELRNKETGRLIERATLTEGRDYQINELSGRVILEEPLSQGSFKLNSNSIIKDSPSGSYDYYLTVDYEYYDINLDLSNKVAGTTGRAWLTDNIGLGGTYIDESRDSEIGDYELKSVNAIVKKSAGTYLMGEYSESEGNQLVRDSNWYSYNGGYDFTEQPTIEVGKKGKAYYIEGGLALTDYYADLNPTDGFSFWYSEKEKGFSTGNEPSGLERKEYGLRGTFQWSDRVKLFAEASNYEEKSYEDDAVVATVDGTRTEKAVAVGGEYTFTERFRVGVEAKYEKNEENDSNLITLNNDDLENGEALLVGTKLSYDFTPDTEVYTKLQATTWKDDEYETNNMVSLGTVTQITESLKLHAEGGTGSRGQAADVRMNYQYNPDHEIYLGYLLDNEDGRESAVTFGQKFAFTDRTKLYQENQFVNDDTEQGILQTYGVDYEYNDRLTLGVIYQNGNVDIEEGSVDRNSVSTILRYDSPKFYSKHRLEFGKDTGAQSSNTWGTINKLKWIPTPEYTLFGEANYVLGRGDMGLDEDDPEDEDSKYYEFGLGLAYRPIWDDRLNVITKYAYIYDDGPRSQLNAEFSQKAHVLSLEGIYDLTKKLSLASKYAIRKEEMKPYAQNEWFESTLDLFAVRATYEIIHKWDAFGEYHWLRDITSDDITHGAIVGLYREVGNNLQVGVGYNFTDFTDDLTDLDYQAKGWYVNLIGKF